MVEQMKTHSPCSKLLTYLISFTGLYCYHPAFLLPHASIVDSGSSIESGDQMTVKKIFAPLSKRMAVRPARCQSYPAVRPGPRCLAITVEGAV